LATTQPGSAQPSIPAEEFKARRRAALEAAAERNLAGLVVWSRGGTSIDFSGDVAYLANHHSVFPVIGDTRWWSARGHSVLVLAADGREVLVTDYLDDPDDRVRIDDVRVDLQLPTAVAGVLSELGLDGERLGVAGRDTITLNWFRQIEAALGQPFEFEPVDDVLERLRLVKSEAELGLLRYSAAVGVEWMNTTMEAIAEGRTEGDAVGEGLRYLASQGGCHYDIAIASGPNSQHYFGSSGTPHWNSTRKLERGDLVHVDQWGPVNGYFTDFARSTVVGRKPSDAQRELLEGSVTMIQHIVDRARPGATFEDLYHLGAAWLDDNGFGAAASSADEAGHEFSAGFPAFGHSMGINIEGPWMGPGETTVLEPNMVLAIESVVGRPGVGAANYEQNVVVRDGAPEILTAGCQDRWWD